MTGLAEFLLLRIAEDEEWGHLSAWAAYSDGKPGTPGHSARILVECDAKRRLVEEHAREWRKPITGASVQHRYISKGRLNGLWTALQYAALPYAEHEDYQEEWAP